MTKNTVLHAGPPITWDKMSGPLKGAIIGGLIYEGLVSNEEEAIKLVNKESTKEDVLEWNVKKIGIATDDYCGPVILMKGI